jgi:arylsulfatase A-like enzyme
MFRANDPRGEGVPAPRQESQATPTSIESLFALGLCAVVLFASMALLERSSDYSRALVELQIESLGTRPRRPRAPGGPASTPQPDLVLVLSLDSLRADHLDPCSLGREGAPRLRRLGEEGVVFRTVGAQASHPLTSHKSLLTGKYPATLMLEETGADALELCSLPDPGGYLATTFSRAQARLAAGFREHGFRTAGFTDGEWVGRKGGLEHGFGTFDDSGGGLALVLPRVLAWLASNAPGPAFVFVQASVQARDLPATGRAERALDDPDELHARYDSAVEIADDHLGRFLDELRARGLYERALVVVTSAHGESLGERGVVGHGGLHLEQILVPLIVKFPQAWNLAPATVTDAVELVDLLPTLFALCSIPAGKDLDGRSLLPVLRGVRGRDCIVAQSAFEEGPALRSSPVERTLVRPGRWQVIQDRARAHASFFALEEDPRALVAHPIAAEEFPALLDVLLGHRRPDARAALRPTAPVRFGEELERELEQLGYGAAALAGHGEAGDLR